MRYADVIGWLILRVSEEACASVPLPHVVAVLGGWDWANWEKFVKREK